MTSGEFNLLSPDTVQRKTEQCIYFTHKDDAEISSHLQAPGHSGTTLALSLAVFLLNCALVFS